MSSPAGNPPGGRHKWLSPLARIRSKPWPERATGIPWVLLAGFCFSLNAVFVRLAGRDLPAAELIFHRALIGGLVLAILMAKRGIKWRSPYLFRLWCRGTTGMLSTASYYFALLQLPLATTSTLGHLNGLCLSALGVVFLGERLRLALVGSLFLGLAGIALVLRPSFDHTPLPAILAALSNGVFVALSHFNARSLHKGGEPEERIIGYFFALSLFYTGIWIAFNGGFHSFSLQTGLYVLAIGLTGIVAQWAITRAYRQGEVGMTSVFSYFSTVFYIVWDWTLWSITPTLWMLLGMVCIAVSGIWVAKR